MLKILGVVVLSLILVTLATIANADTSFNNIAEDKRYETIVVEIVEDSDKEVCITLGGRPEVHCYLKPNPPVSSIKM